MSACKGQKRKEEATVEGQGSENDGSGQGTSSRDKGNQMDSRYIVERKLTEFVDRVIIIGKGKGRLRFLA